MGVGRKGVFVVLALLLAPAVLAFEVEVTPGTLHVDVQAGGYVAELVEIKTDAPVDVYARASSALTNVLKLTRHNETAIIVHVLPPIDGGEYDIDGQLILDIQGRSTQALSASVQRTQIPLNVSLSVSGKADIPAQITLPAEEIDIVPLSSDTVTIIAVIIAGIIVLNIVLRRKRKK